MHAELIRNFKDQQSVVEFVDVGLNSFVTVDDFSGGENVERIAALMKIISDFGQNLRITEIPAPEFAGSPDQKGSEAIGIHKRDDF
jgi:hypothetical protein